jgi:hypothetical protein
LLKEVAMATAVLEELDDDLTIEATDVSGERLYTISGIQPDATMGEVVSGLVAEMALPQYDTEGRPIAYRARLEREGRHLHGSETARDALQQADRLVLHPHITAGAA